MPIIILITILGGCWGQLCGQPPLCYCNTEMGLLACMDTTTETLPDFSDYEKANTVHLDIANTHLKTLPIFNTYEWPYLKIIDLRSNIHLRICNHLEDILPIQDLTLLIDCPPKNITGITIKDSDNTPMYSPPKNITGITIKDSDNTPMYSPP